MGVSCYIIICNTVTCELYLYGDNNHYIWEMRLGFIPFLLWIEMTVSRFIYIIYSYKK